MSCIIGHLLVLGKSSNLQCLSVTRGGSKQTTIGTLIQAVKVYFVYTFSKTFLWDLKFFICYCNFMLNTIFIIMGCWVCVVPSWLESQRSAVNFVFAGHVGL